MRPRRSAGHRQRASASDPPLAPLAPSALAIQRIGPLGDGLTAEGLSVALTLPGERVLATDRGDGADVIELLDRSAERVVAPCPYFGECGGCALQHWAHEPYLAWKLDRIRTALARAGLHTDVSLAYKAAIGERRRVALHARRDGRDVRLGFKARRSWRVVGIESCLIARREINGAMPALRALADLFLVSPKSAPTLHVTLTDTGLDVDVTGVERPGPSADDLSRAAQVAAQADFARVTLGGELVFGRRPPQVRLGTASVALPPGAFLQATMSAEASMGNIIGTWATGAGAIADLFCGVGTFTFRLAQAAPVHAADSSTSAIAALKSAIATAPGLKTITTEARDLERRPLLAAQLKGFDLVVFDPPRAGAAAQAAELARSVVPRAAAVSCNLTTFVRDTVTLVQGGFILERVHLVDQFLFSPHIELVALFSRKGPKR